MRPQKTGLKFSSLFRACSGFFVLAIFESGQAEDWGHARKNTFCLLVKRDVFIVFKNPSFAYCSFHPAWKTCAQIDFGNEFGLPTSKER